MCLYITLALLVVAPLVCQHRCAACLHAFPYLPKRSSIIACSACPLGLGIPLQDMACDTFLKICNKCRRKFVVLQLQEREPFISELLNTLFETIHDLQPHQVW